MSKESSDELLLVLAWRLPFATLFKTALFRAGKKGGRDTFVDMFMWISSYFDSDVAYFLKSIKANLLCFSGGGMKKCRARYGLDQQDTWCKPCR